MISPGFILAIGLFAQTSQPNVKPGFSPTSLQIQTWLEQLADPSYETRRQAVKNLYAAGPAAMKALNEASQGEDLETATGAKEIIAKIQKLYLVGAHVELSASPTSLAWNQPATFNVKITNPSDFPIQLPFLTLDRQQIDQDPMTIQAGNLIDVADFIQVRDPDDQAVEFRMDDYRGTSLEKSLDLRVYGEPTSTLQPQETFELKLTEFNRGLARFPLLKKGTYKVQFSYIPEWDDPKMCEDEIGKSVSNEILLTVAEPAPDLIISANQPVLATLDQNDREIIVFLTNAHDRTLSINANLGDRGLINHAHIEWIVRSADNLHQIIQPFPDTVAAIDPKKFKQLQSGERIELIRIDQKLLLHFPELQAAKSRQAEWELAVQYSNILDQGFLQMQLNNNPQDEEVKKLQGLIPLSMFSGSAQSEFITGRNFLTD